MPRKGTVFVSVHRSDKTRITDAVRLLHSLGFKVMATSGTARFLTEKGRADRRVNKVLEGRAHIVDAITNGDIQLVFNTTEGPQAWPTTARCGALPSCIKCRITPLFQVPWRRSGHPRLSGRRRGPHPAELLFRKLIVGRGANAR